MAGKLILFGAGGNGLLALRKYGREQVAYFCDNNVEKQGTQIEGITVVSFQKMLELYHCGYIIMITPAHHEFLVGMLELEGIYDYLIFRNEESHFTLKNKEAYENEHVRENSILSELVRKSSECDLLEDITALKEQSAEALRLYREENLLLRHYGFNAEGQFYGNLQALVRYAGISEEERKYFPVVSHYDSIPEYGVAFAYKSSVIMSGTYFREQIHKRAPYVPVFSVGPFIHYAENIYDKDKINVLKKKNGKTLLAFLPHSIESKDINYGREKFIDLILAAYNNCFDSIWLCVYWADINHPVCEYAQEKGIHVVSAGFRFDTDFDRRLKTIFELSDAVVCGDMGTFIAYALHMGKPIARLNTNLSENLHEAQFSGLEKSIELTQDYKIFMDRFCQLFDDEFKATKEQKDWMNGVSGFDQIRSAEYIKNIFQISKDIWLQCEGNMQRYPEAVRQVYRMYEKLLDFDKMSVLRTAVGAYVDYC